MKAKYFTILFSFVIIFWNCEKKKYPETLTVNDPEFYALLNFANDPVTLEAGKGNYRIFSSFNQDVNGLYCYVSEIRKQTCSSQCPGSFSVKIYDSKLSPQGGTSDISSAIHPGVYDFKSPEWKVKFISNYNKTPVQFKWKFGDGIESIEQNPEHTYKKGGTYTVSLSITSANGCESTLQNQIQIGYQEPVCKAVIGAIPVTANSVQFNAITDGTAPFQYYWEFGDGQTSTSSQPLHNYPITGAYLVRLTVTDSKGKRVQTNYNLVTSSDLSSCATNFSVSTITATDPILPLSSVSLFYTDNSGKLYSTADFFQNSGNRFEVISTDDYEVNERGEPTKKLKIRFSGWLFNGQNSLYISDSEAIICISYKN